MCVCEWESVYLSLLLNITQCVEERIETITTTILFFYCMDENFAVDAER